MKLRKVTCLEDISKCRKLKKYFAEISSAKYTDRYVIEMPLDVAMDYVYEKLKELCELLLHEDKVYASRMPDLKIAEHKKHCMLSLSVMAVHGNHEIAIYFKKASWKERDDIRKWIMQRCLIDLTDKGFVASGNKHEDLMFRLTATAY